MKPIGIIGGSGFYELIDQSKKFIHDNKYGRSSEIYEGKINGHDVYFIPRHGPNHNIIVPRIPYRANIWALHELGVERIIATNSVGSINENINVGDMVIPDDYINFTSRTPRSLYDDTEIAYHVEMNPPYCPEIRSVLIEAAHQVHDGAVHDKATIAVIEGLSFSSPAEYRMYQILGAQLVGMTTMPEAILAREAGICYAHICMPTDKIGAPIRSDVFQSHLKKGVEDFKKIIAITITRLSDTRNCPCAHALDHAILSK